MCVLVLMAMTGKLSMTETPAALPGESEKDWMQRLSRRDPQAATRLVETFQRPIVSLGLRLLRSREEAEDLCQEVFLTAILKAKDYEARGSLSGWIFRIAVNQARNRLRRPRLESPLAGSEPEDPTAPPIEELARRETAEAVRQAVDALPERQRLAVLLQRYEGLSYLEIAQVLETTVGAVESLLHRACCTLRERLKKIKK